MKIPKLVQIKDTVKLFNNKHNFKVVLVTPLSAAFRGNRLNYVFDLISSWNTEQYLPPYFKIRNGETEVNYINKVALTLATYDDYELRVETPLISIYTNNPKLVEEITNIDATCVKYVSLPNKKCPVLKENTVIVKKLDYDYKVHLGFTKQEYTNFIKWATGNSHIKLTKRTIKDLSRSRSWGGGYFYVKGDKALTMVKMFLGHEISKIEHIIKG